MCRSCDGNQIWPFFSFQENLIHLQHRKCSLYLFCFSKAGKQEYSSGRTKAILADFPAHLNPGPTGKPLRKPGDCQHNPEASGDLSTGNRKGKVRPGKQQEQPSVWYFCTATSCLGWSEVRDFYQQGSQSPGSAYSAHKGQEPGSRAKEIVWDISRW